MLIVNSSHGWSSFCMVRLDEEHRVSNDLRLLSGDHNMDSQVPHISFFVRICNACDRFAGDRLKFTETLVSHDFQSLDSDLFECKFHCSCGSLHIHLKNFSGDLRPRLLTNKDTVQSDISNLFTSLLRLYRKRQALGSGPRVLPSDDWRR